MCVSVLFATHELRTTTGKTLREREQALRVSSLTHVKGSSTEERERVMRNIILSIGLSALAFSGVILGAQTEPQASSSNAPSYGTDTYAEECSHEGCYFEEVREMRATYTEECFAEGCWYEEKQELAGGGPLEVQAMEAHFRSLGWAVFPAFDE